MSTVALALGGWAVASVVLALWLGPKLKDRAPEHVVAEPERRLTLVQSS
jgi:hypothetical protein